MKIELEYIENLAKLLTDYGLTELGIEEGDKSIIIKKELAAPVAQPAAVFNAPAVSAAKPAELLPAKQENSNLLKITSPMVGTFYGAPSPGSAPFVQTGKTVSQGQTVCIIEAMKLMNEIESDVSGKVVEICVQDGQPVEYGQVLMLIEA